MTLSLLALAVGCGAKPPPAPQRAEVVLPAVDAGSDDAEDAGVQEPDARVPLPPADTPEEVAERWLEALRRVDADLLGTWSRYPFMLHDTGAEGTCGHGAAADAAQLTRLLGCLLHNNPLIAELRSHPEPTSRAIKAKDLPAWARRFRDEAPSDATFVLAEFPGHGNASQFMFVVHDGGVRALWKQTLFETN